MIGFPFRYLNFHKFSYNKNKIKVKLYFIKTFIFLKTINLLKKVIFIYFYHVNSGFGTPVIFALNKAFSPGVPSVRFNGIINLGADGNSLSDNTFT